MKPETQTALESAAVSTQMAFGIRSQMIKTCEELGELSTQLCKHLNDSPERLTPFSSIVDEIADVLIMTNQMRIYFGPDDVDERIRYKLDRTMEFIRTRKGEEVGQP